jgi:transposase-like protein
MRKDFARTCNICRDTESATANTLFHKVKFGLKKAFFICFEMATTTKSLSASQTAVRFGVQEKTARMFMQKVREAMKSSEDFLMKGIVNVDEYVVGGYQEGKPGRSYRSSKKKAVCAVELTDKGKVKRFYTFQIPDYSAKSLRKMFDKHIDKEAKITTDKWKGYNPIANDYDLKQVLSDKGANFKALHVMIHQVKSWIRTTYSWVSENNINRYFDEFCYQINRSQSKDIIFNNLIKRMVKTDNITHRELICG